MKNAREKIMSLVIIFMMFILVSGFRGRYGGYWRSSGGGAIKYTRGNVEITSGFTATTGNITATNGDVVATNGDIQAVAGDIIASTGNVVVTSGEIVGVDTVWGVKTITKTISIVPAGSTDDFAFAANADVAEQPVDLGALVPAYAELVSAQIRCFEAVVGGTMSIDLGVSTGVGDVLAAGATDALNEINTTVSGDSPKVAATNAVKNIWINATPSANWSTLTAGRYSVMVTYVDYGAAHTWSIP